jgi:hypothetical protein
MWKVPHRSAAAKPHGLAFRQSVADGIFTLIVAGHLDG